MALTCGFLAKGTLNRLLMELPDYKGCCDLDSCNGMRLGNKILQIMLVIGICQLAGELLEKKR